MKIIFHTNLDLAKNDVNELTRSFDNLYYNTSNHVPRVGEYIQFDFEKWDHQLKRSGTFNYQLQVCQVVHNYSAKTITVELHLYQSMSIKEWEEWFSKHRYNRG